MNASKQWSSVQAHQVYHATTTAVSPVNVSNSHTVVLVVIRITISHVLIASAVVLVRLLCLLHVTIVISTQSQCCVSHNIHYKHFSHTTHCSIHKPLCCRRASDGLKWTIHALFSKCTQHMSSWILVSHW